ncbi:MAG: hypothetical protein ACRD0F_05850 [Acidimicrobiales bacterium]
MTGGLLPPFGEPEGPLVDDQGVLEGFLAGHPGTGHSAALHVEGETLVTATQAAAAMRLGPGTVLVRADLPDEVDPHRAVIGAAMRRAGLALLDSMSTLAPAVAIQRLGLRFTAWDLWGTDLDEAFADLRAAATGDDAYRETLPPVEP